MSNSRSLLSLTAAVSSYTHTHLVPCLIIVYLINSYSRFYVTIYRGLTLYYLVFTLPNRLAVIFVRIPASKTSALYTIFSVPVACLVSPGSPRTVPIPKDRQN